MAGIIISSSVCWAATGKFGGINRPRIVIPVEFTIPLKRRRLPKPNSPEVTQVALIEVILPSGSNLPTTVSPSDIPLDDFKEFPFRPLVVEPPSIEIEMVVLDATYAKGSNSRTTPSQPVVVPGTEVMVQSGGQIIDAVELTVGWIWKIKCQGRGRVGVRDELFVPLKLDGGSHDGWETPVTLQLLLPNGEVVDKINVDPNDIPLGEFQDFAIHTPSDTEIELTVTATQTGGPGTTLVVGDVYYKSLGRPIRDIRTSVA